jgi:hypothetical protein
MKFVRQLGKKLPAEYSLETWPPRVRVETHLVGTRVESAHPDLGMSCVGSSLWVALLPSTLKE